MKFTTFVGYKSVPKIELIKLVVLGFLLAAINTSAQYKNQVGLNSEQFIDPSFSNSQKNFQMINGELNVINDQDGWNTQVFAQYVFEEPLLSYINVRELSYQFKNESTTYTLGRHLKTWSILDSKWNLGAIQPILNVKATSPEQQGFTGLFVEHQRNNFAMTFLVSSIYIPNQNAQFAIEKGEFKKANPWFSAPPSQVVIEGNTLPINYDVNKPEISEIIFRPTFATQFLVGSRDNIYVAASGFYKPSNYIGLGYDEGYLNIPDKKGDVTIQPQVYNHKVYSADVGYKISNLAINVSSVYEEPEIIKNDETFIYQNFADVQFYEIGFEYNTAPLILQLSQLQRQGGSTDLEMLGTKYLFEQATMFGAQLRTRLFNNELRLGMNYKLDNKQDIELLSSNLVYRVSKDLVVQTQVELIEGTDLTNSDYMSMGVGYVF